MEGYLQKRFKMGVVKTLKKRWCVLKDGELRCYPSKDTYEQNVELHQECIPVNILQTIRAPSDENFGIQLGTQQKVTMLVASSREDQQRWIDAIYEMKKEDRPRERSLSCPDRTTEHSKSKKRQSIGKTSITRILPATIKRKISSDNQNYAPSTFYLQHTAEEEEEEASLKDIGTQVDSSPNSTVDGRVDDVGTEVRDQDGSERAPCDSRPGEDGVGTADGTLENPATADSGSNGDTIVSEDESGITCNETHTITETGHVSDDEEQGGGGSSLCPDENTEEYIEHMSSQQETQSDAAEEEDIEDSGIQQLKLMLGTSTLSVSGDERDAEWGDQDDESGSLNLEGSDDGDADNDAEDGNSAFQQLQEMLIQT